MLLRRNILISPSINNNFGYVGIKYSSHSDASRYINRSIVIDGKSNPITDLVPDSQGTIDTNKYIRCIRTSGNWGFVARVNGYYQSYASISPTSITQVNNPKYYKAGETILSYTEYTYSPMCIYYGKHNTTKRTRRIAFYNIFYFNNNSTQGYISDYFYCDKKNMYVDYHTENPINQLVFKGTSNQSGYWNPYCILSDTTSWRWYSNVTTVNTSTVNSGGTIQDSTKVIWYYGPFGILLSL